MNERPPTPMDTYAIQLLVSSIAEKEAGLAFLEGVMSECTFIVSCAGNPLTFDVSTDRVISNERICQPELCVRFNKTDADRLAANIKLERQDGTFTQAIAIPARTAILSALTDARNLLADIKSSVVTV